MLKTQGCEEGTGISNSALKSAQHAPEVPIPLDLRGSDIRENVIAKVR
jgi:hypothetical protein